MTRTSAARVAGVVLAAGLFGVASTSGAGGSPFPPPTFSSTLPSGSIVHYGDVVEFTVWSTHARPDSVSLVLQNPPAGCVFEPGTRSRPPATHGVAAGLGGFVTATASVRWVVANFDSGYRKLQFHVVDATRPSETFLASLELRVEGAAFAPHVLLGDVTGDGVLDTVGGAWRADVAGVRDTGAVYVWSGGAAPSAAPTATLQVTGAKKDDHLGKAGPGLHLADVTGDGVLDVVAVASDADVGGVVDVGAIDVWKGGATLTGVLAPDATLTVPGAVQGDQLGVCGGGGYGQGVQIADVTGDGVLDLVVTETLADSPSFVQDVGAIQVWKGGAALVGSLPPFATLTIPGPTTLDSLGSASAQPVQLEDVTGDGILDVVAGAEFADGAGVPDQGSIYVWAGGATLVGAAPLLATLQAPGAALSDRLGAYLTDSIRLVDVTGDGVKDVIASAVLANFAGIQDAGAVYVWRGGAPLSGSPTPLATLVIPGATAFDQLGMDWDKRSGVQLVEVTGDRIPDVVVAAMSADVAGVVDAGAIFVWQGGAALAGAPPPLATLTVPGAKARDELGKYKIRLADVTGDAFPDLLAVSSLADVGSVADAGAIHVWRGGPTLSGTLAPLATLTIPSPVAGDQLGLGIFNREATEVGDVSGDGIDDVIAGTAWADVGGKVDAGAIWVWRGGPTLTGTPAPLATLTVPGAANGDELCSGIPGIHLADVTGDDVIDLVSGSAYANQPGIQDAGAVYLWKGGATLTGSIGPTATLTAPGPVLLDQLGSGSGLGIQFADVSADGILDVVTGSYLKDFGSLLDAGAVYVWFGGATLSGPLLPNASLQVPSALPGDQLGNAQPQAIQLADVTGDDVLDVIGGAWVANVGGVVDTGAIYEWKGGATLLGTPALLQTLTVPGASAGDKLGG